MFIKKIISGILIIVTTSMVLVPCYAKLQDVDIDEVNIKATNCSRSIIIEKSDTDELKFDYDTDYFQISTDQSYENKLIINIEQIEANLDFRTRATIYLPDKEYNNVYAELDTSAMTFKDIDYPLNVDAKTKSAVALEIAEGFSSNINFSGANGAYSVDFLNCVPENLKFVIDSSKCAVSLPYSWQYKPNLSHFEYKNGDGSSLINLDIKASALAVRVKDDKESDN